MKLETLKYRTIEEREYKHAPSIHTTPEEYCKIFDELFASGEPILNRFGEELIFEEDEEVRQCYVKGDHVRSEFPFSWFLSSKGNLISVIEKTNKLFWVTPDLNEYDRLVFKFAYYPDGIRKIRNIKMYNLLGLVYDAERVGLADALLKTYGLDAFKYRLVEGHHTVGKDCNEPSKIQFLTGAKLEEFLKKKGTHQALRILNKDNITPEEERISMHAISDELHTSFSAWLRESYDKDGVRVDSETLIKPITFKSVADYWLSLGRLYDYLTEELEMGRMVILPIQQEGSAEEQCTQLPEAERC